MRRLAFILFVSCAVSASMATATIIRVPSEYSTIQAGIDAAVDGDTVLVADGEYSGSGNQGIRFYGKAIVVMSENGPEATIIFSGSMHGFIFRDGEDTRTVVQGFTVRLGGGRVRGRFAGGGIHCYNSSPTIRGNIIRDYVTDDGGGIYCEYSSAVIEGNIIANNYAADEYGLGGGILSAFSSLTIKNNIIMNNKAEWKGGGIYWANGPGVVEGNLFVGNLAMQFGGGICCREATVTLNRNTFTGNRAHYGDAGAIYCYYLASMFIQNCICWADSAREGPEIYVYEGAEAVVTYCDVEGGWPGEGNIDADPLFVSGPCGGYYLSQPPCQETTSPCIDAGDPDSPVPRGTTKSCNEICDDWPVDMGYHHPCLWFTVTPDTQTVERGGILGYTVGLANDGCGQHVFSYWSDVYLWTGEPYKKNPIFGPKTVKINPGKEREGHVSHTVPNNAPLKTYSLCGRIGHHDYEIWDEGCFEFNVVEGLGLGHESNDWQVIERPF